MCMGPCYAVNGPMDGYECGHVQRNVFILVLILDDVSGHANGERRGNGKVLVSHVFMYLRINMEPRHWPSACSETLRKVLKGNRVLGTCRPCAQACADVCGDSHIERVCRHAHGCRHRPQCLVRPLVTPTLVTVSSLVMTCVWARTTQ